jgi:hypothetical protein
MRTTTFFVAALMAAGCDQQDESFGSVGAALTATDDSGATYRLPAGSRLDLGSSTYFDSFSLDGDAAVVHIDLPVGDYQAWLSHDFGYTSAWPLQRTAPDGTVQTVTGYLITPMPQALTIFEGTTTSLVLAFEVPEFGAVTFAEGTLDVSVDIEQTTAGGVEVQAGAVMNADIVQAGAGAPPELATRLPALGDAVELSLGATITGPWNKASSTSACAPGMLATLGAVDPGVIDLVLEANGAVQVCVFDSEPPQLRILATRIGAPSTPTFDDLPGDQMTFLASMIVELPGPVFDGETLDLDPAAGTHTAFVSSALEVGSIQGGEWQSWYHAGLSGTGGVSVTLTP